MKKQIWLVLLLMGCAGAAFSQPGRMQRREHMESMKVGFITQKLDLTTEEAQKFWPVYNRFNDEMEKNRKAFRGRMMEELGNMEGMSDAEADKALNEMITFRSAEAETIRKYVGEFKKVLPPQKVVKLFVAEEQFKRELLRKLREQRD